MFCGNGGSAADAQHLIAELTVRLKIKNRKAIPALSCFRHFDFNCLFK